MTFTEIAGEAYQIEDQDEQDYIRDDGGFGIYCHGHFTLQELETKIAQLKDANRFFKKEAQR